MFVIWYEIFFIVVLIGVWEKEEERERVGVEWSQLWFDDSSWLFIFFHILSLSPKYQTFIEMESV